MEAAVTFVPLTPGYRLPLFLGRASFAFLCISVTLWQILRPYTAHCITLYDRAGA
jgi:hypothetical protein